MTREELRVYVDEQRSLNNIPYHVYSALIDGIDELEQDPTLDKIRAEIAAIAINGQVDEHTMFIRTGEQVKQMVLDIIDKYKAKSEDEE